MHAPELQDYLRRITEAESIADVNAVVRLCEADHPDDPDVEAVKNTATTVEAGLLAALPARRRALRGEVRMAAAPGSTVPPQLDAFGGSWPRYRAAVAE